MSSSFDTGETSSNEKMFSDSDFKKLVESIGAVSVLFFYVCKPVLQIGS